jgi:hypothetical protein
MKPRTRISLRLANSAESMVIHLTKISRGSEVSESLEMVAEYVEELHFQPIHPHQHLHPNPRNGKYHNQLRI